MSTTSTSQTDTSAPVIVRLPREAIPNDDRALEIRPNVARQAPEFRAVKPNRPIKPPVQSLVAGDNKIDFGRQVVGYKLQNNTGAVIYRELDEMATPGSFQIAPGDMLAEDMTVRHMHIYVTAATALNDAVAGVFLEGGI